MNIGPSLRWALLCTYQHRLLTTPQVGRMIYPNHNPRSVHRVMERLMDRGLVDRLEQNTTYKIADRWFATSTGCAVVESAGDVPARSWRADPERHALTWPHLIAENDLGIAFLEAARERGDPFARRVKDGEFTYEIGWLGWEHELAYPRSSGSTMRADIRLVYEHADGREQWLIAEVDRDTQPLWKIAAKAIGWQAVKEHGKWRRYELLNWPTILFVTEAGERRVKGMVDSIAKEVEIGEVDPSRCPMLVTTFDEIETEGVFAPHWRDLSGQRMGLYDHAQ